MKKRYRFTDGDEDLVTILGQIYKGDDRATAIVGAAFVDDALEQVLRLLFKETERHDIDKLPNEKNAIEKSFLKVANDLFAPDRSLGSFRAKIDLSFALGVIGYGAFSDFTIIKDIRNLFAHHMLDVGDKKPVSFETPAIVSLAQRFSPLIKELGGGDHRLVFAHTCTAYTSQLFAPMRPGSPRLEHGMQVCW